MASGVRRKDTTKGPPLRVLSLDGGGVRGYSMLIIVQELMHRTFVETEGRAPRRHEIPKPCDHFDLIVGTGTGGLIAIMLGRLRLNIETCKELYVRMTRMVFETDKTIAGIPYRSTLFKASKLEEAIRQAVAEHTVDDDEGDDRSSVDQQQAGGPRMVNPLSNPARRSSAMLADGSGGPQRQASNASVLSFSARSPTFQNARPAFSNLRYGDPNSRLYDSRENRTKTAVTAIFKDSPKHSPPVMLRSYDSRYEPPPEFDCRIWQAGRATCAVGLAFKPIRIGQSLFHDDGVGTFNPAPEALDEAVLKEWPGRDVGVFVSVGTGKRPRNTDGNQHQWYEGFMGEFAEARRRLISKIENCERIHEYMLREYLAKRGVNVENYYRLNVEVGVGDFGMNEWHRLGDISTSTRRYMTRDDEQGMIRGISTKLAKIHLAKLRRDRAERSGGGGGGGGRGQVPAITKSSSIEEPFAVELPGDAPTSPAVSSAPFSPLSPQQQGRASFESGTDSLHTAGGGGSGVGGGHYHSSSRSSREPLRPVSQSTSLASPSQVTSYFTDTSGNEDRLIFTGSSPSQYRIASGADAIAITSPDEQPRYSSNNSNQNHQGTGNGNYHPDTPPGYSATQQQQQQQGRFSPPAGTRIEPPPLPPKTPLPTAAGNGHGHGHSGGFVPPYPIEEDDAPPPVINMARKPDVRGRLNQ